MFDGLDPKAEAIEHSKYHPGIPPIAVPGYADPFYQSTCPRISDPQSGLGNEPQREAKSLAHAYMRLVDKLTYDRRKLVDDQESLALMLSDAQATFPPDEALETQLFFLRDGLELRLREFEEECRRASAVERRFQRKLDDVEAECEIETVKAIDKVDPRLIDKMEEQRRIIRLQQDELDQIYFERDVLMDDIERLKEELSFLPPGNDHDEDLLSVKPAVPSHAGLEGPGGAAAALTSSQAPPGAREAARSSDIESAAAMRAGSHSPRFYGGGAGIGIGGPNLSASLSGVDSPDSSGGGDGGGRGGGGGGGGVGERSRFNFGSASFESSSPRSNGTGPSTPGDNNDGSVSSPASLAPAPAVRPNRLVIAKAKAKATPQGQSPPAAKSSAAAFLS